MAGFQQAVFLSIRSLASTSTHKITALILISKEEFLHCKILLREFDCKLNMVQHLSKAHLRYSIFERKSLNGHVNYPFTYTSPDSIPALSDHQKIMSWTILLKSIKEMASELWLNIIFFDFIDGRYTKISYLRILLVFQIASLRYILCGLLLLYIVLHVINSWKNSSRKGYLSSQMHVYMIS